ncbi:MAG: capsule assembly Wzi family protein [Desulfuromusa sp.]|nr:capsule assembly Wzi family protein [Desulfuromusa sp.]
MIKSLRFALLVSVLCCLSLVTPFSTHASVVSPLIPLDSWVYPALDKLSGLGLINSSLAGSRPYSRIEAARQVEEANLLIEDVSVPPVALELLQRLETELAESLTELGDASVAGYFKPVRQLRADYIYQDGDASHYPQTDARQFALNKNNFGIDYVNHNNGQLTLQGDGRISRFLGFEWQPLLLTNSSDDLEVKWLTARVTLALGPVEISAGRQSLGWGQGYNGSLLLGNNAKPLDMIRINTPSPIMLPWLFKYLGPFQFDVFWSQLEEERQVPEPYFAGMRVNMKPLPWLELGATRTVMFGGDGRPDVDLDEFITILGGKNLDGDEDSSNSIAAIDLRIFFPSLWGAEIYGEIGGEDEANHFFSKAAWLAGVYLPQVEPTGRLSLRLEYTDLSDEVWYRHSAYRSGYTYKNHIMGHHIGGAAKDYFAEARLLLRSDLELTLGFDYQKRGENQLVEEKHYQASAEVNWWLNEKIRFELMGSVDRTENFDFVTDNDPDFYSSRLSMIYSW